MCMQRCNNPPVNTENLTIQKSSEIVPVQFPQIKISGVPLPEDSITIYKWLDEDDTDAITTHGWGISAGLTSKSGDTIGNDYLYVFETCNSPSDLKDSLNASNYSSLLNH